MAVTEIKDEETFAIEYLRIREWLLKAHEVGENTQTEEEFLDEARRGLHQIWAGEHSAYASCIIDNWNGKRICCISLIGGERAKALREVFEVGVPTIEAFALKHKCEGLLGIGRAGWVKIANLYGFEAIDKNNFYKEVS